MARFPFSSTNRDDAGDEPTTEELPASGAGDRIRPPSAWVGAGGPEDTGGLEGSPGREAANRPGNTDRLPAVADSAQLAPSSAGDIHPEDPDDEWLVTDTGRTVRVKALTGGLILLVVLAGGFWGGVLAEKHHGTGATSGASALAAAFRNRAAAATGGSTTGGTGTGTSRTGGFGGSGGFGGAAGSATVGTVVGVTGNTIEVSDSQGNLVKVTVGPSTTVTRTATVKPASLQVGDTVIVTGSTGSGASVSATVVRATAQGTSTGFGSTGAPGATGSGSNG